MDATNQTPNHALQRTGAAVTAPASCLRLSPAAQGPRQPRPSLSLGSLGDFAHLIRAMSAFEDIPSPMPSTKSHEFEDFQLRVYRESDGLGFGSFASISQPRFPEFAGEPLASSTAPLPGVHREAVTSTLFTRRSSERLDSPAVFGFPPSRALHRVPASKHSRSGIHRESGRHSRNSFRASVLTQ